MEGQTGIEREMGKTKMPRWRKLYTVNTALHHTYTLYLHRLFNISNLALLCVSHSGREAGRQSVDEGIRAY